MKAPTRTSTSTAGTYKYQGMNAAKVDMEVEQTLLPSLLSSTGVVVVPFWEPCITPAGECQKACSTFNPRIYMSLDQNPYEKSSSPRVRILFDPSNPFKGIFDQGSHAALILGFHSWGSCKSALKRGEPTRSMSSASSTVLFCMPASMACQQHRGVEISTTIL